jgi:hypothetical protein
MNSKVWNGSCLTDREKRRQVAIETVDGLFGNIEGENGDSRFPTAQKFADKAVLG